MIPFRGLYYRNAFLYNLLTFIKLGFSYNKRFKIAAEYIPANTSVIDVCSGIGILKNFLPPDCPYECIDNSQPFNTTLKKKGITHHCIDLNRSIDTGLFHSDILVMIISLAHFKNTVSHDLLESFKKIANKVVIVEDVLIKNRAAGSIIQKTMNYLCGSEYELYTRGEFKDIMDEHGYFCKKADKRYYIGLFENNV